MRTIPTKPLLAAALGHRPERTPVWFLRQAGRYLPEYMEIRKKVEFVELCSTPAKAAEVTLQPLRRFDLDGAIIFSDILIPCIALGQKLTFDKGHGPILNEPVRDKASFARLSLPNHIDSSVGYVGEAIALTKQGLNAKQTMIGFAGAPFTVASYMIEGCGSKNYTEVRKLYYNYPEIFRELLKLVTEVSKAYLAMQVNAGAEYIMLFDTWANQIPAATFRNEVFPYVQDIARHVRKLGVPVAYFPGQGLNMLTELRDLEVDVIHVDWRPRMSTAIRELRHLNLDCSVQGNLDPQMLLAPEALLKEQIIDMLNSGRNVRGHIFNVGHGLLPFTPPEAISYAVSVVREWEQMNR